MLATMYGAGLRVSEVAKLKVSDLDRERRVIWVRGGKGHKDRQVMLAEPLREVLAAWWKRKRPAEWLFPGKRADCPVAMGSVFKLCEAAAKKAGITKPVRTHSLRHAFATRLLDEGVNLLVIQALLGHAHLRTAAGYLHLSKAPFAQRRVLCKVWIRSILFVAPDQRKNDGTSARSGRCLPYLRKFRKIEI